MQLDQNAPHAPKFPNIDNESAVQQYFEELGLHELNDPQLVNEKKFTLALYKLIFEECRDRPDIEYGGGTFRRVEAGWYRGIKPYQANKQVEAASIIGKYKQNSACSVRFHVTFASLPNQTYHCNVWVYLDGRSNAKGPTLYLNVRVEYFLRGVKYLPSTGKVETTGNEKIVSDFQLQVSKLGWENVRNDEDQYWEIGLPISIFPISTLRSIPLLPSRSMPPEELRLHPRWQEEVPVKNSQWIKDPHEFKARWEYRRLSRLPMAEKVTWENSKEYLAQLLYYAISRAEIKFNKKRELFTEVDPVPLGKILGEALKKVVGLGALGEALGKAGLEALEKGRGPEKLREALRKARWEARGKVVGPEAFGKVRWEALGKARLEALGKARLEALGKASLETLEKASLEALEKGIGPEKLREALRKARWEALGKASLEAFEKASQEAHLKARLEVLELEKARLDAGLEALEKARLETLELEREDTPGGKNESSQLLEAGETIRKTRRIKKKATKKKAGKKKTGKKKAGKKKAGKKKTGKRKAGKRKAGKRKAGKRKAGKRKAGKKKTGKKKAGKRKAGKKKAGKRKADKRKKAKKKNASISA